VSVPVTALYAGLLGLLAVFLANFVLYVRIRAASQPKWRPAAALRVQANFVENVPLALVLLGALELQEASPRALHALGASLVCCRVLHAYGLGCYPGPNYPRLVGAQGSFRLLSIPSVALVYGALRT
jgi:hypothetical protein